MDPIMQQIPDFYDLKVILPELTLAIISALILLWGAFDKKRSFGLLAGLSVAGLMVVGWLVCSTDAYLNAMESPYVATIFGTLFRFDAFAMTMKWLILIGSAASILFAWRYFEREGGDKRPEFFALILLATLGMMVMVSANNFLTLYVGLELQSLSLYVLAAFERDRATSSEAGLKYFVLGALSSGMLLFGISFIYGFAGTTDFNELARIIRSTNIGDNLGLVTGTVFMLAGLAFKVSAVPFHMWTPDVYEGAPTPVTAFFAVGPKVAALALMVRVISVPYISNPDFWQNIVQFMAAASIIVGSIGGLRQINIKRLMAYSSIGHMGFVLMGLASASQPGVKALVAYMIIYLVMSVGAFACILAMRRHGKLVEKITDLSGLSKTDPITAFCLLVLMFSMTGIPPLAGFFAKFYVITAAANAGLYLLAVVGVVASVIAAFYYLNIVKIMYFDEPSEALDRTVDRELRWIMLASAAFLILFVVYPDSVMAASIRAATLIYAPA